ncbi:flagellar protein FliT [Pseudomonas sp. S75]|uniref:flagellar protein FliT n=1 Tax=unclassified Pseudomonas TaxID=196821 RepID=UPI001906197E|nr:MULTISPECIES: flagellar protein FliT [unclassified Pseudomonas]MBJ9975436.1 flagellar protein FliT [Pseudomonas sp. S30]MBK0152590.1 flagellar protein FliT [Pseudomonas sp. S75]
MSEVIARIDQTRDALLAAFAERDWAAVGELDLACRVCVEEILAEAHENDAQVRASLDELLGVYRQLIDVASGERQSMVEEMSQIRQAKNATKVYHLFS